MVILILSLKLIKNNLTAYIFFTIIRRFFLHLDTIFNEMV